jgi:hypothetical protein
MSCVIETINDFGLKFELYDDGDCVVTSPEFGFLQITADIIARLSKNSAVKITQKKDVTEVKPSKVLDDAMATTVPVQEAKLVEQADVNQMNKKIGRKIEFLPTSSTWECVFQCGDERGIIRHEYKSRSFARAATPETQLNTNGRVA